MDPPRTKPYWDVDTKKSWIRKNRRMLRVYSCTNENGRSINRFHPALRLRSVSSFTQECIRTCTKVRFRVETWRACEELKGPPYSPAHARQVWKVLLIAQHTRVKFSRVNRISRVFRCSVPPAYPWGRRDCSELALNVIALKETPKQKRKQHVLPSPIVLLEYVFVYKTRQLFVVSLQFSRCDVC